MKILGASASLLFLLLLSSPAWADDVKSIINENGCFACHSMSDKLVGPSFKMVADRYRGQKGADEMLAKKIIAGGNGHWDKITGGVMMPPHPNMSQSDAEEMAKWVLSLK